MKKTTYRLLLPALLLASIAPAGASLVDVTNADQVTLDTNGSLLFYISEDLTSAGHGSIYPGEVEMILGATPLGGPVASITGTSSVYLPNIPDAGRLGLSAGDMLPTPGIGRRRLVLRPN